MSDIERLRAADLEFATRPWRRGLPRYGGNLANDTAQRAAGKAPELAMGYCGDTVQYGRSPAGPWFEFNGTTDYLEIPIYKFNTEGEKQMEKIDWHKPLRAFKTPGHEVVDAKVYTYKSGRQRVVWVDERVYPVDDQGRAVANVDYGLNWVKKGHQIVENVPEEKFFVVLTRQSDNTYWLVNNGQMMTRPDAERFLVGPSGAPCAWVVDTRKSAEPPKAIEHDPEDYVTVWFDNFDDAPKVSGYARTKSEAEYSVSEPGEQVVRVRTTPAPVDTSRYIQLWRISEKEPWKIIWFGNGRQEFTWEDTRRRGVNPFQCAIKVRD